MAVAQVSVVLFSYYTHESLFLQKWDAPFFVQSPIRIVTAKRSDHSAKLLSGGTSGWSRKYHHCSALSYKELGLTHRTYVLYAIWIFQPLFAIASTQYSKHVSKSGLCESS